MHASTTVSVRCPSSTKQGAISAAISASPTASPLRNFSASGARRDEPTRLTSQPCAKSRIRACVYSRLTVPLVPSTETRLVRDAAQAGLIAGHRADKGHLIGLPQLRHHQRRSGVAGDDDEIGVVGCDQLRHQRHDTRGQCIGAVVTIGEERIVADIDVSRIRTRADDLARDGEAAEAGIENENGGGGGHGCEDACGLRVASSFETPCCAGLLRMRRSPSW